MTNSNQLSLVSELIRRSKFRTVQLFPHPADVLAWINVQTKELQSDVTRAL